MERYDANEATKRKLPSEIVIGDQTFAVKRSGKALKRIIEIEDEIDFEVELDGDGNPKVVDGEPVYKLDGDGSRIPKDKPGDAVTTVYRQLAEVLVVPDKAKDPVEANRHPNIDWLEDELDFEVASEILEMFLPERSRQAREQAGNLESPPSETAPAESSSPAQDQLAEGSATPSDPSTVEVS